MLFYRAFKIMRPGTTAYEAGHEFVPTSATWETVPQWPKVFPGFTGRQTEAPWTPVIPGRSLRVCQRGWHLAPATDLGAQAWVKNDYAIFLAEIAEGASAAVTRSQYNKFVVSECRLVRRLTPGEVKKITDLLCGTAVANQRAKAWNPFST